MMKATLFSAAAALMMAGTALAHDYQVGDLHIDRPVARETPANAPVSAGYMTIRNRGQQADRLIGGSADFAGEVELHEMVMDGDVMQMRQIEGGIEIPPGGEVVLQPGGLHVMFIDMRERLRRGREHQGTLVFENAGTVDVTFQVESLTQIREAMDNGTTHHDHDETDMQKPD